MSMHNPRNLFGTTTNPGRDSNLECNGNELLKKAAVLWTLQSNMRKPAARAGFLFSML